MGRAAKPPGPCPPGASLALVGLSEGRKPSPPNTRGVEGCNGDLGVLPWGYVKTFLRNTMRVKIRSSVELFFSGQRFGVRDVRGACEFLGKRNMQFSNVGFSQGLEFLNGHTRGSLKAPKCR